MYAEETETERTDGEIGSLLCFFVFFFLLLLFFVFYFIFQILKIYVYFPKMKKEKERKKKELGCNRIELLTYGLWDHHSNQLSQQPKLYSLFKSLFPSHHPCTHTKRRNKHRRPCFCFFLSFTWSLLVTQLASMHMYVHWSQKEGNFIPEEICVLPPLFLIFLFSPASHRFYLMWMSEQEQENLNSIPVMAMSILW